MNNRLHILIISIISVFTFSCREKDAKDVSGKTGGSEVVATLTNAVKQYPDSAGLRMRLIKSLDSIGMYKNAIEQTDSLIGKDSLNNGLWFTKAQLQESNKDTVGAIQSYTRAINVYPSPEAQLSLANLYAETKNVKALLICRNVERLGMGREADADCKFIAGIYYARNGNNKEAIGLFDKAINDNYTLMEAYMEKGFVYYEEKNYPEALKVFEKATTVNNTYADAYYWKAKCYEAMGNKPDALTDYKRSLGLDKKLTEAEAAITRLEGSQ